MLTEYALTPHLFDDQHNVDDPKWLDRIRAFGNRLLPVDSSRICNTVVSNLYDGSWLASAFLPLIQDLQTREAENRPICLPVLDLLKALRPRIESCLVKRPFCSDIFPETEEDWISEAESSATRSKLPIHRFVGSHKLPMKQGRHNLDQTQDETFWDTVPIVQWIPADLNRQLLALRRMCSFYSFFAFASPQLVAAGGGKDLEFAIKLAKSAFQRPHDFSPPTRIDYHTTGIGYNSNDYEQQANAILQRVHNELGPASKMVRIFLWKKILERRLLVGHYNVSDNRPRVVWGVAMTHVARPGTDKYDSEPHTFSVMGRHDVSRLFSYYYNNLNTKPYTGSPWTIP